ncbi:MAG: response regulator [Rubrivivax sp.]|nr:response regulator [Rubrivivax sp.]
MSEAGLASTAAVANRPPAGFDVLVVDDEPNILSALRRMLRAHGYRVQTAPGGSEALALLEQAPVDLIISDMRMPEMNGAEFLRRSRERVPEAVRILLTGYADIGSTIDAVNNGEIFRYVSKPWNDEALLATLRDGLERKQLERERDRLLATVTRQHEQLKGHAELLEQRVMERTQALSHAHVELQTSHDRAHQGFMGTLRMLSHLLDQRAGLARGCGRAAATLVQAIGPRLALSPAEVQDTFHAALLEDLGRLGLPDRLIDTPLHALAGEHRRRMQRVPLVAEGHLLALPALAGAGLVLHHLGERWDGQGEPDGLKGAAILAGARLLRVVSDYERLKAGCIETRRFTDADARRWLGNGSGTRYDPAVVQELLAWFDSAQAVPALRARLGVAALLPGMVLAQDLSAGNVLLVAQGRTLDATLIKALAQLEQRQSAQFELEIEVHDPL